MASAKPTAVISTSTSDISSLHYITFGFIETTLERYDQKAESKEMTKGYKYFCEKYIKDIKVYSLNEQEEFRVTAKCFRSQKKNETPHESEIWLRKGPVYIKEFSKCSCTIGMSGFCGHITGVLYTLAHMKINNITSIPCDIIKTSLPQTWHIPRGETIGSSTTDNLHLYGYNVLNPQQPTRGLQSTLYNPLVSSKPLVPVSEFITRLEEVDTDCLLLSLVEKSLSGPGSEITDTRFGKFFKGSPVGIQQKLSKDYMLNLLDVGDFLPLPARNVMLDSFSRVLTNHQTTTFTALNINMDECHHIEEMTRLQSLDPKWHAVRKDRITASVAGDIAKRKADYEPLVTRLKSTRKVVTESMRYGLASEPKQT